MATTNPYQLPKNPWDDLFAAGGASLPTSSPSSSPSPVLQPAPPAPFKGPAFPSTATPPVPFPTYAANPSQTGAQDDQNPFGPPPTDQPQAPTSGPANPPAYSQPGPQAGTSAAPPPITGGPLPTREQIAQAYKMYLGRPIQETEYQAWLGNANFAQEIYNSPEASALREIADIDPNTGQITYKPGKAPPPGQPNPGYNPGDMSGYVPPTGTTGPTSPGTAPTGGNLKDPAYVDSLLAYWGSQPGVNPSVKSDPNYWKQKILSGELGSDQNYIIGKFKTPEGAPAGTSGQTSYGSPYGNPVGGGSTFSDPATQEWEANLRSLVDRLNSPQQAPDYAALIEQMRQAVSRYSTPANNPDFQPFVDYMRQYFQQLQGPAYTPAQTDLIQTQSLDPLERQKQAEKTQVLQQMAARGIDPSSGIAQSALLQVDTKYAQMETQARAGFATNAINLQRQNQAQAGQVAGTIAGAQQQNQTYNDQRFNQGLNLQQQLVSTENTFANTNEQRALQAIQLLFQIPQLADQRLGLANQTLQQGNPATMSGLFGNLAQFGQLGNQQNQQDQQYWAQIGAALAQLFGMHS